MKPYLLFAFWIRTFMLAMAQGPAPNPGPAAATTADGPNAETIGVTQIATVSGMVRMEDGSALPDRVPIVSRCGDHVQKETYADVKGSFHYPVRARKLKQAATTNEVTDPSHTVREQLAVECTIMSDVPGYQSSVIDLANFHLGDRPGNYDVGTIVLSRSMSVKGTAASALDARAPKEARRNFEKGRDALDHAKPEEARKALLKAVEAYPSFAGAWILLGHAQMALEHFDSY